MRGMPSERHDREVVWLTEPAEKLRRALHGDRLQD